LKSSRPDQSEGSRHTTPLGTPGSSLALLHSHSSGHCTSPAFTGLLWIYSLAARRCRSSRMKRSQYSRCQTRCTVFDVGDSGSKDERFLPVKDFHDATVRAIVQPSIGWKSTWTWLGITTQANSRYRTLVSSVDPHLDAFAPFSILPFWWDGP